MRSLTERFGADLRQFGGWLMGIATAVFLVSGLATYIGLFAMAEFRHGTLSVQPPREPLGFIRAVDPHGAIVTHAETVEDLSRSMLDEPGMGVLLEAMERDERIFMTLPLDAFSQSHAMPVELRAPVLAIVGTGPPFLDAGPTDSHSVLWGSTRGEPDDMVHDSAVFGHPVRQIDDRPPGTEFVRGSGHAVSADQHAVVALTPSTARAWGIASPPGLAEIVASVTCYCSSAELSLVADQMTAAEAEAGTGRVFYSTDYAGLIGPVERSRALTEALIGGPVIVALLGLLGLVVVVLQVCWARRWEVYAVEVRSGAREMAIHVRTQLLVVIALTVPALLAVLLVNSAMDPDVAPPPLSSRALTAVGLTIIGAHLSAGASMVARVRRLCRDLATTAREGDSLA